MKRRDALTTIAGGLVASTLPVSARAGEPATGQKTGMGIGTFSYHIRWRSDEAFREPFNYLEHCHQIGAGGIQMGIGVRQSGYIRKLRQKLEEYEMYIEGSAAMPEEKSAIPEFEKMVAAAKEVGMKVIRTAFGQRRYEQFEKAEEYREFSRSCLKSMLLAEPVAARHGIRLAIENHKDWLIPDMIGMLEQISSEYVGVCVDTGNSFALLEDPLEMVKAYAPWAFSTHIKDMAVAEYQDGFLLADVPLGEGLLDLREMARVMRAANPDVKWTLEMATREALKVPCLTERYWATFEKRPGVELARALKFVRENASKPDVFMVVNSLPVEEQIKLEEANVRKCLAFAEVHLSS